MNESSVFLFSGRKESETGLWKSSTNSVLKGFGLRPESNVCSEHMNDWEYLSLGDLIEQNEFFSKSKS